MERESDDISSSNALPTFPVFTELCIEQKVIIEAITSRFAPYSDFNFISLYSWNTDNSVRVSLLHGNLVIKLPDYLTGKPIVSILGDQKVNESIRLLLEKNESLKLVPEATIDALKDPESFSLEEDADNHDYLYDLEEITRLYGSKFKKIRNKLNSFKRSNIVVQVENSSGLKEVEKKEFIRLFDQWTKTAKQSQTDSATERIAIIRLLDASDSLNCIFTKIRLGHQLVAFSISELIDNKYAVCHFEKALSTPDNLFIFVAHEGSLALLSKGVKYANWEQDMGLAGLREAKSKWQPRSFLKKYSIYRNKY